MAKYIDVNALLDELSMSFSDMNTNVYDSQDDALEDAAVTVRQAVYDATAADVAPVRHGEWQPPTIGKYGCVCSICKAQADNDFDYCPNCGAKMDGGYSHE